MPEQLRCWVHAHRLLLQCLLLQWILLQRCLLLLLLLLQERLYQLLWNHKLPKKRSCKLPAQVPDTSFS